MFDLFKKLEALKAPPPAGPVEYLIVGLGNPGRQYEGTRHNAGFLVLERLAEQLHVRINRLKYKALTADTVVGGRRVLLIKPQTFMNLSGQSVREAMNFYKIPPENVIILFDDISLPPGKLRIRKKGSDGGHNGMKNIIYLSGKDTFPRVKVGVGAKPHPNYCLADWVLSHFTEAEYKAVTQAADQACEAVRLMVEGKTDQAMNQFNS